MMIRACLAIIFSLLPGITLADTKFIVPHGDGYMVKQYGSGDVEFIRPWNGGGWIVKDPDGDVDFINPDDEDADVILKRAEELLRDR